MRSARPLVEARQVAPWPIGYVHSKSSHNESCAQVSFQRAAIPIRLTQQIGPDAGASLPLW